MERYLKNQICRDLSRKIVLLSGPRQTGKTTLSKMLLPKFTYLNYGNAEHRLELLERSWDRNCDLVIFDELHKQKNWKSWLKGIYDTESISPTIIVTGSARLDTHRKVGDSLAGRFFPFRLHPLDVKEIRNFLPEMDSQSVLERLLVCGGFPEPFLEGDQRFYKRWRRTHLGIILRQDLVDLENVQHISSIQTLVQLLRKRVGSPISYNSLARDLQCSDRSVKRWLQILENMYVIFRVSPYHRNIARSLLKSPKYYFYDTGQVLSDNGIKLENLTACALLKECHFLEDCEGSMLQLYYLQTKDGRELDFFVTVDEIPLIMVEVKWNNRTITRNFKHFRQYFTEVQQVQITGVSGREKSYPDGTELRNGCDWLADLSLSGD